jgi:hypothetical protein
MPRVAMEVMIVVQSGTLLSSVLCALMREQLKRRVSVFPPAEEGLLLVSWIVTVLQ